MTVTFSVHLHPSDIVVSYIMKQRDQRDFMVVVYDQETCMQLVAFPAVMFSDAPFYCNCHGAAGSPCSCDVFNRQDRTWYERGEVIPASQKTIQKLVEERKRKI